MEKNYGFIEPEIEEEDYVFGQEKLGTEVLCPTGQWNDFLPEVELQNRNGLETSNCTVYSTLNVIEALFKRLFDKEVNYSERYIGVIAKTTPRGNSVQRVIEVIRKKAGLIQEKVLPFSDEINSWEQYYSPNPMSEEYLLMGKTWLDLYKIKHEWVFDKNNVNKIRRLKESLKFSPIGVSVRAWSRDDNGFYYKEKGRSDNHYVMLYGYVNNEYWKIFDHYNNTYKKLRWDYDFGFAKRYFLSKKEVNKKEFACKYIRIIEIIMERLEKLKKQVEKSLGKVFNVKQ